MHDNDEPIDISDAVADLTQSRKEIAFDRACRKAGYIPDEDDRYDPSFMEYFGEELKNMVVNDVLDSLKKKGLIETSVDDNGELHYALTEEGHIVIESEDDLFQ